jgi:hypothetical protein
MPNAGGVSLISTSAQVAPSSINSEDILNDEIKDEDIKSSAAIAYSKLALADKIVNADIKSNAAIIYSKLSLADSIKSADVDAANGIVEGKLATSDITTGDVSTSKHGYAPKAPNDTTKFLNGAGAWSVPASNPTLPALEAGNLGDVMNIALFGVPATATDTDFQTEFGGVSGVLVRKAIRVIGNGSAMSTMKLNLRKFGSPTNNLLVTIETDSAGLPSGTLIHANANASVSSAGLTTSFVDTTITFAGAFTPTLGQICWIVLKVDAAASDTNYLAVGGKAAQNNGMFYANFDSAWYLGDTTYAWYVGAAAGFYLYGAVKNRSATLGNGSIGLAAANYTLGASMGIVPRGGICTGMSGLNQGQFYPASATNGGLGTGTTAGGANQVGQAISDTSMMVLLRP